MQRKGHTVPYKYALLFFSSSHKCVTEDNTVADTYLESPSSAGGGEPPSPSPEGSGSEPPSPSPEGSGSEPPSPSPDGSGSGAGGGGASSSGDGASSSGDGSPPSSPPSSCSHHQLSHGSGSGCGEGEGEGCGSGSQYLWNLW